jgi:hypothetical protein
MKLNVAFSWHHPPSLFDVLAGSSHTLAPKREEDGHEAQADSHLTVRDWDNSQDYDDTDQRQFWLAVFNNVRCRSTSTSMNMKLMLMMLTFSSRVGFLTLLDFFLAILVLVGYMEHARLFIV